MILYDTLMTPVGELLLTAEESGLTGIVFDGARKPALGADWRAVGAAGSVAATILAAARSQLAAYFEGKLTAFDLPLVVRGTPFQQRVWTELRGIGFGESISYAELARRIGAPAAIRAVGGANGKNPHPIVVPCHRVIGADGSLTGFGGGVDRKRWLLEHEGVLRAAPQLELRGAILM